MMTKQAPTGAADPALARKTHLWWIEEARRAGLNLTGFDLDAPPEQRIAWAEAHGLEIAGILARQSTKMQHSIESQVQETVRYAAWHQMYPAPEFVCVDEGVSGRKTRRAGLDRMRSFLEAKRIKILLVYKVSRLFRSAYKGYAFFQENVVEEGLRAVSVSQGIDTRESTTWSTLAAVHGLADQMLLQAIADHVRSGIRSLFLQGFVVGALPVGYQAVEVPGAPTNRGKPRTMPQINAPIAKLIVQAYEWVRDGMPIKRAWRRWVAAGGPCDPRSTLRFMSYPAFRRLLSNPRYIGRWAFGRKRNQWSSRRDYIRQTPAPDTEVAVLQAEELRIVSDELYFAVQAVLEKNKIGPRGPKKEKNCQLWDMVTDLFYCSRCGVRFYQAGANGKGMTCKRMDLCPCKTTIRRSEAIGAICRRLTELLRENTDLIERTAVQAEQIDRAGDGSIQSELDRLTARLKSLSNRIADLMEMAGQGSDADRAEVKAMVRSAQGERATLLAQQAKLLQESNGTAEPITAEMVREILRDLDGLLVNGAAGLLGADVVHRAAASFRLLVGGRIWVHVDPRPGRKRTSVRGVFRPDLIRAIRSCLGQPHRGDCSDAPEVEVWLRQPPQRDRLAERVHQLIDVDGLSYRGAAKVLQAEGHRINSGVVWQIYRRYYEMQGLPVPVRPYNNGRPRQARKRSA